jgi:hypothetical protein
MADALQELADHCHGDSRPDCPILHDLANNAGSKAGQEPQHERVSRFAERP